MKGGMFLNSSSVENNEDAQKYWEIELQVSDKENKGLLL